MSAPRSRGLIAPLALVLLHVAACGAEPEQASTLRADGGLAKAGAPAPSIRPATPATLAEHVESKARALALAEYVPPDTTLVPSLAGLDYEQYRSIRFRPERALWRGETPFEIQLMHPGFLFRKPVRIHLVQDGEVEDMPFDPSLFSYDGPAAPVAGSVPAGTGYSGFRVHYPLNDPDVEDEVVVFQGASYFRLLGAGHVYGMSSRGLAVGIGGPEGEEFPDFEEFWLVRPDAADETLVFHALLDSPSVTGAYRFELDPGAPTVLGVEAHLFSRRDVSKLGVAPLSSMFLYGPNSRGAYDDFRPEVHDSDGLLMLTRLGEWIWRPLSNRPRPSITALFDEDPQGFGLVQRARDFDRYLDLEAQYQRRPSEWVQVEDGGWGAGAVELLEMPTESEFRDNVAAAWVPSAPFAAGEERTYRYRLITFDRRLEDQTLAQVERTGIGWDALPGEMEPPPRSRRRFIVDFAHGALDRIPDGNRVEASLETTAGEISDLHTTSLPSGLGWRVTFRLDPEGDRPADMRLYLKLGEERLSETWSYVWYPDQVR